MKTSELLLFYFLIKKQRQKDGFQCEAIKRRIDMINAKLMKEEIVRINKLRSYNVRVS